MTITRTQIIQAIKDNLSLPEDKAKLLVQYIIECLQEGLLEDGKIMITNFGSFRVHHKKQRMGRNPKTGENVPISERKVICFKFTNYLKEKIIQEIQ